MHWTVGNLSVLRVMWMSQGKLVALFGVPDMGKVCQQNAFPDYLNNVRPSLHRTA